MPSTTPGTTGPDSPHQGQSLLWAGAPLAEARGALVLVHGRGGSSEDILNLGLHLASEGVTLVAPAAAQHTWYPFRFLEPTHRNEPWLTSALTVLDDVEATLTESGIDSTRVVLVGFSQGACLASESLRRRPRALGGLLAFAGGVIGPDAGGPGEGAALTGMPALFACGDADPHIPAQRVRESAALFTAMGAEVDVRLYKGMGHGIHPDGLRAGQTLVERVLPGPP
ncbi:MAG: dienelactone hydrolase family protein [Gemmatimonadota bacterium]